MSDEPITFSRKGPIYIVHLAECDPEGPYNESVTYFESVTTAKYHIYDTIVKSFLAYKGMTIEKFSPTEIILSYRPKDDSEMAINIRIQIQKEQIYG